MKYKLNIIGGLAWLTRGDKIKRNWTPGAVMLISNMYMGLRVSLEDATWISNQLNLTKGVSNG